MQTLADWPVRLHTHPKHTRAQGIYVAAGLRVSSGTAILSTLLLLLAAPAIGFGQHGVVWALVSTPNLNPNPNT